MRFHRISSSRRDAIKAPARKSRHGHRFGAPAAGLFPAYARRRPLYQLYHLLNHMVLFGAGYERQALACARACLAASSG
jgi:hypothetical protein